MKVLVFGYSDNPDRYSNIAANLLQDYKHETIKFNPRVDDPKLLDKNFDTVTLYVSPPVADQFQDLLLGLNFKRVIFNPGTENFQLEEKLKNKGVEVVRGCTLVMLRTSQF
ncbi:MAG: CoA-binding protein [Bacteriovorax sp.]|nr:CoA-binding protein [Bacteriovorax sp.]